MPEHYRFMIQQVVRDLFLEKNRVLMIDIAFERVSKLTFQSVEALELFDNTEMPQRDGLMWNCDGTTFFKFMKPIGFVHEKLYHYEHKNIVQTLLQWQMITLNELIGRGLTNDEFAIKTNHGFSKNVTCAKIWKYESGDDRDQVYYVSSGKMNSLWYYLLDVPGLDCSTDVSYYFEDRSQTIIQNIIQRRIGNFLDTGVKRNYSRLSEILIFFLFLCLTGGRITLYWMKKIDGRSIPQ